MNESLSGLSKTELEEKVMVGETFWYEVSDELGNQQHAYFADGQLIGVVEDYLGHRPYAFVVLRGHTSGFPNPFNDLKSAKERIESVQVELGMCIDCQKGKYHEVGEY